ncbi:MAG: hypothetical protein ACR2G6_08755 [Gemmatimonadaceae bacterium]
MQRSIILSFAAIATFATAGEAQRRDRGDDVPPGHRPPPGMCRIWLDGIAPGLQPKPTDCATAEREAGENAHIIYGDRTPLPGKGKGKWKGKKDKDRDRWCDNDERRNDRACRDRDDDTDDDRSRDRDRDRDRDRNADWDRSRYPDRLPEMGTAILYRNGQRPAQVRRWLGERELTVQVIDLDNNGQPERATWRNRSGELVQIWTDRNRDGRADRVEIYDDGKRVRVFEK